MAPTLVASYLVLSGGNNTTTLTTPAFAPANGEVIAVKACTWDVTAMNPPTGGAQTYTQRVAANPGGFHGWCAVWTSTISGSPGPMTINATPAGSCQHSMVVERWSNAQLAAPPAVNSTVTGANGTPPRADIITTAAGSVLSWCSVDEASIDPTGRAYLLSATEDGIFDGHAGANSVHYYAHAQVEAAGTYTMGMSLPANQIWVLAGLEIQALSGVDVTATDGAGMLRALRSPDSVSAGALMTDPAGAARALRAEDAISTGVGLTDNAGLVRALRSPDAVTVTAGGDVFVTDPAGLVRLLSAEDCWRAARTVMRPYTGTVIRPDAGWVCRP